LSGRDASLFLTHSPCINCAKAVFQAGVKDLYYIEEYRSNDGLIFLEKCGVNLKKIALT
jgi:dCMP deaminase